MKTIVDMEKGLRPGFTERSRFPEKEWKADKEVKRKPSWIRGRAPGGEGYGRTRRVLGDLGLKTVCEEAACPNLGECWDKGHATVMIMGEVCTRACAFCNVSTGKPGELDADEPRRVGDFAAMTGLKHVVVTSVDRDDLEDGGADHFRRTVRELRERAPGATVEILTPDFRGKSGALEKVMEEPPDVFNHNVETVPRLYRRVRPGARYYVSLRLLDDAREASMRAGLGVFTKSGLMVGLGEEEDEVHQVLDDLRGAGVDFVTAGQYLQPTRKHATVERWWTPEEFARLESRAYAMGFTAASASPMTRSSYHAGEAFERLRERRRGGLRGASGGFGGC